MNVYSFLRLYKSLANNEVLDDNRLLTAYWDVKEQVPSDAKWFQKQVPDKLELALALDSVAHEIHAGGNEVLQKYFPGADWDFVKSSLDELAGLEKTNDIRKVNRGYFTPLLSADGMLFLEKAQTVVGKTTLDAVKPAIQEYERLYIAGFASPAEILTLARYYPQNAEYQKVIKDRQLEGEHEPVVVGGPASVEMIDREGHLITVNALRNAFSTFMGNFRVRNLQALHSDVQVGWILPAYITKTGDVYASGVDDRQLWVLSELRDESRIAQRMAQEIKDGNIKSYSIAGSALNTENVVKGMTSFMKVNEMEMAEISLCLTPDSRVWTNHGLIPIKDVVVGDMVFSHMSAWRKVLSVLERDFSGDVVQIETNRGSITVTKEHPIYVSPYNRDIPIVGPGHFLHWEWVNADQIRNSEICMVTINPYTCSVCCTPKLANTYGDVKLTRFVPYTGKVYNLEVDGDNSFSTSACVVHNCANGVNQGANFKLLKSADAKPSLEDVVTALEEDPLEVEQCVVYLESSEFPRVLVRADRTNDLTEAITEEIQRHLPEGTPIVTVAEIPEDAAPLFKVFLVPEWGTPGEPYEEEEEYNEDEENNDSGLEKSDYSFSAGAEYTTGENDMDAMTAFHKWIQKEREVGYGTTEPAVGDEDERYEKLKAKMEDYGFPEELDPDEAKRPVVDDKAEPWMVNQGGEPFVADAHTKAKARGEE